ncbi:MAG: FGGY-family carbohydrate kinase [Kiritimatiellae bacterium]|nr:FGGY-family carbohydrate kinase [Kiritimatiellia bacterium]
MANYLLGMDYGTGGAKGCVIDDEGNVLGYGFEEYPILNPKPGWSEHDPALYWAIACRITKGCVAQAGIDPKAIRGIAVSSALPSLVMVDKAGNPINNAYNLMDRRATAEVDWLKAHIGEDRIFKISGNRLEDHPCIVKLMWERNNRPESYKKIHKALTIEGYITQKLTGAFTLLHGSAALYGVAYNLVERRFDGKLLDEIGLRADILPELYDCETLIGEVTPEAAAATGLAPGIPVCAGQVDFNASCVASGVIHEGDIQSNLGTCGNFGIIHKDANFMFEMIALGFTVDPTNTFITIPTTTTGGQSIRYLRDTFGQAEMQAAESLPDTDAYDLLNQQAEKVAPGSEGLIVLPFLMGERTPIWDVDARGCIFGLSLNHTKGHVVRATMEGVAYAMYDSFRMIKDTGRKINFPIVMHEGGAKSSLWRQIITDVFDTPTVLTKRRTGAPFGDAILAGVATGVFPDFSVSKAWAEYVEQMEPNAENHERYMAYFQVYKDLYEHVKGDYKALAGLRE